MQAWTSECYCPQVQRQAWTPPPPGSSKLNVDGAVARNADRGAVVVVCRDANGHYLGSSSVTFARLSDAPVLEALACREALALAQDLLLPNIIISSDCQVVVGDIAGGRAVSMQQLPRKFEPERFSLKLVNSYMKVET